MNRVSVIVPTYNRADVLRESVASALQQTRPPAEIIIVDDGSTDDTAAVCRYLPEAVRYIRQENAGVSAARNRGIREANGEWLAFLDSDDVWEPGKLEVQLAMLEGNPSADWCATGCTVVDGEGKPLPGLQSFERVFEAIGPVSEGGVEDHFGRWLTRTETEVRGHRHVGFDGDFFEVLLHGNVVLPSSAMVRRGVFEAVGGFDEALRLAEETEFFHRLAVRSPGIMVMSRLVRYRTAQAGSLTNPKNAGSLIRNAIVSAERAVARRGVLTDSEDRVFQQRRQRLLSKLAYTELSLFNRAAARRAQREAWRSGAARTPRTLAIYSAALFPIPLLRGLHRLKRIVSAAGRSAR
jgi:glycosyltransferase involved in cell wall biosynthesis